MISKCMVDFDNLNIDDISMATKVSGILQINIGPPILAFLNSIGIHTCKEAMFSIFDLYYEMRLQFPTLNEFGIPKYNFNYSQWHVDFMTKIIQNLDVLDLEFLHHYVLFFEDIEGSDFDNTTTYEEYQFMMQKK